jgi:hypothetical protein
MIVQKRLRKKEHNHSQPSKVSSYQGLYNWQTVELSGKKVIFQ